MAHSIRTHNRLAARTRKAKVANGNATLPGLVASPRPAPPPRLLAVPAPGSQQEAAASRHYYKNNSQEHSDFFQERTKIMAYPEESQVTV